MIPKEIEKNYRVYRSILILQGYCAKHRKCDECGCAIEDENYGWKCGIEGIPCDWKVEEIE